MFSFSLRALPPTSHLAFPSSVYRPLQIPAPEPPLFARACTTLARQATAALHKTSAVEVPTPAPSKVCEKFCFLPERRRVARGKSSVPSGMFPTANRHPVSSAAAPLRLLQFPASR